MPHAVILGLIANLLPHTPFKGQHKIIPDASSSTVEANGSLTNDFGDFENTDMVASLHVLNFYQ